MTSVSVAWQETSAKVGDTIHSVHVWFDAKKEPYGNFYALCQIRRPDGTLATGYTERNNSTSNKNLSCTADAEGTWLAKTFAYDGSTTISTEKSLIVSSAPPPPPPPPPPAYYNLTLNFNVTNVKVTVSGFGTFYSGSSMSLVIGAVPSGTYTVTCIKSGYTDNSFSVLMDTHKSIFVTMVPLPPTTFSITIHTEPPVAAVALDQTLKIYTDETGWGLFENVSKGNHTLICAYEGYLQQTKEVYVDKDTNVVFILEHGYEGPCVPGATKCYGADLYECNAAGTKWILKQANSPTCQPSGEIPDFWSDPVGWVVGVITLAWEGLTGYVLSQFKILQQNFDNFLDTYGPALTNFITNAETQVRSWVDNIIPTLQDWWGDIVDGVGDWYDTNIKPTVDSIGTKVDEVKNWIGSQWDSLADWWKHTSAGVQSWINNAVKSANDWIKNFPDTIGSWWDSTSTTVKDWIGGVWDDVSGWIGEQWDNLGDWWDETSQGITDAIGGAVDAAVSWITDKFNDFLDWLNSIPGTVSDFIGGVVSDVQEWTVSTINDMVGAMFEWAKPVIQPIIDAATWLGKITGVITKSEPENPVFQQHRNNVKSHLDKVKEILKKVR